MKKKGSYFFVIDAFIAAVIIFITLVTVFSSYTNTPKTEQPQMITEDYINLLLSTEMRDLENSYRQELINNNLVSNMRRTVFEQIAELYHTGHENEAKEFVESLVQGVIPEQFGIAYYIGEINDADIDENLVYQRYLNTMPKAGFIITTKRITYFRLDSTTVIGPELTQVLVWPRMGS